MSVEKFLSNWASQVRKGILELVVMASLEAGERYGYELVEHIKNFCGLEMTDGTLYTILTRFRSEGFVDHRWEHLEKGPARKYYRLTDKGHEALAKMRGIWTDVERALDLSQRKTPRDDSR